MRQTIWIHLALRPAVRRVTYDCGPQTSHKKNEENKLRIKRFNAMVPAAGFEAGDGLLFCLLGAGALLVNSMPGCVFSFARVLIFSLRVRVFGGGGPHPRS